MKGYAIVGTEFVPAFFETQEVFPVMVYKGCISGLHTNKGLF